LRAEQKKLIIGIALVLVMSGCNDTGPASDVIRYDIGLEGGRVMDPESGLDAIMSEVVDDEEMQIVFEVAAEQQAPIMVHIRRGVAGDTTGWPVSFH